MKLSIIIPSFNEVATLPEIIKRIKKVKLKTDKEVIVIDDGSVDGTRKKITKINGITNFL